MLQTSVDILPVESRQWKPTRCVVCPLRKVGVDVDQGAGTALCFDLFWNHNLSFLKICLFNLFYLFVYKVVLTREKTVGICHFSFLNS